MSLLAALTTPPKPKHKIGQILLLCSEEERVALETALRGRVWSSEALAELLTAQGHNVSEASVRRYRRDVLGLTR